MQAKDTTDGSASNDCTYISLTLWFDKHMESINNR